MRGLWTAFLTLLVMIAAPPARADENIWQATGPLTATTMSAMLPAGQSRWFMLYAAPNTALRITGESSPCPGQTFEFYTDDHSPSWRYHPTIPGTGAVTYMTPGTVNRYFVELRNTTAADCPEPYTVTLDPPMALVAGPPMPSVTQVSPEPRSKAKAYGPLAADTWYATTWKTIESGHYYTFFAQGPVRVDAVANRPMVVEVISNGRLLTQLESEGSQYVTLPIASHKWRQYTLLFYYYDAASPANAYSFSVGPAANIRPGPPAPPGSITAVSQRTSKRRVVLIWADVNFATSYQARVIGRNGWITVAKPRLVFKRAAVPAGGIRVKVRAVNSLGRGPVTTIRVRRP